MSAGYRVLEWMHTILLNKYGIIKYNKITERDKTIKWI